MAVSTNFNTVRSIGAQTTNLVNQARQNPSQANLAAVQESYRAYFAEMIRANAALQQGFTGMVGPQPTAPQPPAPPPFNPNPFGPPAPAVSAPAPPAPAVSAPEPAPAPAPAATKPAPPPAAPEPAPAASNSKPTGLPPGTPVTDDHGRVVGFI